MTNILRYESSASEVYDKLKQIERTGWVMRGVKDPETVYEHTASLVKLAESLQADLRLTTTELDDLQHILEVHDWAEALVGDQFVPNEDRASYEEQKLIKAEAERTALERLLHDKPYKQTVADLFARYEVGADPIAILAKQLDKYQALELALEYEQEQGIPLFEEFLSYYDRDQAFTNPALLEKIDHLKLNHTKP